MPSIEEVRAWRGRDVIGSDGHRIGTIDELYADDDTGEPAWALVHTGLFGRKSSFVPISGAVAEGDDVLVPFEKAFVKDAPGIEPDGRLTPQEEDELFRYYGRPDDPSRATDAGHGTASRHHHDVGVVDDADRRRGDADRRHADERAAGDGTDRRRGDTDRRAPAPGAVAHEHGDPSSGGRGDVPVGPVETPGGLPGRTRDVDDAMTLSEEQVHVGTRELPATKVRMRKVTVTEDVQVTVPVTREEVRLEEVPIDAPDVDDALPADGEVTLRQEVPVIQTRTVDSERVRLEKDRVTEQVEVTEPARREEAEVEHHPADGRPDGRP